MALSIASADLGVSTSPSGIPHDLKHKLTEGLLLQGPHRNKRREPDQSLRRLSHKRHSAGCDTCLELAQDRLTERPRQPPVPADCWPFHNGNKLIFAEARGGIQWAGP